MLAKPWKVGGLVARLASRWLGLATRARRLGRPDAVVVGYLGHFDVHLARLLYRAAACRSCLTPDQRREHRQGPPDRGWRLKQRLLR